jgi:hypothetical protein
LLGLLGRALAATIATPSTEAAAVAGAAAPTPLELVGVAGPEMGTAEPPLALVLSTARGIAASEFASLGIPWRGLMLELPRGLTLWLTLEQPWHAEGLLNRPGLRDHSCSNAELLSQCGNAS